MNNQLIQSITWDTLPELIRGKSESEQFNILREFFGVQSIKKSEYNSDIAHLLNSEGKKWMFVIGVGLVKFPHFMGSDPYFVDQVGYVSIWKEGNESPMEKMKIIIVGIREGDWYSWFFEKDGSTTVNYVKSGSDSITSFPSYELATIAASNYFFTQNVKKDVDTILDPSDKWEYGASKVLH